MEATGAFKDSRSLRFARTKATGAAKDSRSQRISQDGCYKSSPGLKEPEG
jgi:hypothetical protein